jgi:4-amino-4-deoxy-L-arabinose transferase-like glycosyltransferase
VPPDDATREENPPLFSSRRTTGWVLAALIGASFVLRYWGIHHSGFPLLLHPDEWAIVNPAWNIVVSGDPNPHFFTYGSLNVYLQVAAYLVGFNIAHVLGIYQYFTDVDFATIHLWGRLLIIVSSCVTLGIVFKTGKLLFNSVIPGYVAFISLAVSLIHVRNSIAVTPNSLTTLFVVLSFYFAMRCVMVESSWRNYIFCGISCGLAVACKYTMIFGFLPLILCHVLRRGSEEGKSPWSRRELLKPVGAIAIAVFAFLVTNPFAVLDPFTFAGFIEMQQHNYSSLDPGGHSYLEYARGMVREFGAIQLLLVGIGAGVMARRNYRSLILVAAIPVSLFLFVGWYPRHYIRNLLPAVPFLALLVGSAALLFVPAGGHKWKKWMVAATVIVLALFAYGACAQLLESARYLYRSSLPRTEARAKKWIEENLPEGSVVAREGYRMFGPPGFLDREKFTTVDLNIFGLLAVDDVDQYDYLLHYVPAATAENRSRRRQYQEEIYSEFGLLKEIQPDEHCAGPRLRIYRVSGSIERVNDQGSE